MRMRALLMLGLAGMLGAVSVYLVRDWVQRQAGPAAEAASVPVTTVVVARSTLAFGTRLGREHLHEVNWPRGSVPHGAFAQIDEVIGNGDRVVLRTIEANEPVLGSKVSGLGGRATLSTIIAEDMRAMTIRVNDVHGVAGFVLPGDRVDVLLTREERDQPVTDVLLQNVKVLGIDQEASDNKDKPKVARAVTLEVTPDQGQKLTLGSEVGTLSLSLRNQANVEPAAVRTVGLRDLRSTASVEPVPGKPAAPVRSNLASVGILRGTAISKYEVRREGAAAASALD